MNRRETLATILSAAAMGIVGASSIARAAPLIASRTIPAIPTKPVMEITIHEYPGLVYLASCGVDPATGDWWDHWRHPHDPSFHYEIGWYPSDLYEYSERHDMVARAFRVSHGG